MILTHKLSRFKKKPFTLFFLTDASLDNLTSCRFSCFENTFYPQNELANCLNADSELSNLLTKSGITQLDICSNKTINIEQEFTENDSENNITVKIQWNNETYHGFYLDLFKLLEIIHSHLTYA